MMRALAIAIVLALASTASAEDWSEFIDHSPPAAKTPAKTAPRTRATKASKPAPRRQVKARAKTKPRRK